MIIKRLTLHNFGVYANTNTFEFKSNKPIVLIGGQNGRGKTTFLDAVLLSLYGSNSFSYKESKYSSYSKYLLSYINRSDCTNESYVEISFVLDKSSKDIITIRRSWSGNKSVTKERITVKKNEIIDSFLTENWSIYIENILPSALSSFFFFDGEKIAELAADQNNKDMTNSIKSLLGVTVIEDLKKDIKRIISSIRSSNSNGVLEELEHLRKQKEIAEKDLFDIDEKIEQTQNKLVESTKKHEQQYGVYINKGGEIASQHHALVEELTELKMKINSIDESLISLAASELPLNLVLRLLNDISIKSEKEIKRTRFSNSLDIIKNYYKEYILTHKSNNTSLSDFINYLSEKNTIEEDSIFYNLSDNTYYQLQNLLSSNLSRVIVDLKEKLFLKKKTLERINEIQNYLSIEIDELAIKRAYKKLKVLEKEKIKFEAEIEVLKKERVHYNGTLIKATSAFNKYVESYLAELDTNEDNNRTIKYSYLALKILDEFQNRVQIDKIDNLAQVMTERYKMLANKENLISKINIDPITLKFKYINSSGEEILKDKLSAGEKQLMVIAMLWALAICSNRKLPVIIDTPLSRLDTNHRLSLINNYFPYVSEQTIILSTDSEIDNKYYKLMRKSIGDKFTLIYDDKNQRSTIKSGYYFTGE